MGDLIDEAGRRAEGEEEKSALLARSLFGTEKAADPPRARTTPQEEKETSMTLRRLLEGTSNKSAPGPDGVTSAKSHFRNYPHNLHFNPDYPVNARNSN